MRCSRIYTAQALSVGAQVCLEEGAARHLLQVLRIKEGAPVLLFNGDGQDYDTQVARVEKKKLWLEVKGKTPNAMESPLKTHLGQALLRGDKMDFCIKKAVELGVTEITLLHTERVNCEFKGARLVSKLNHWQQVIHSACEQSGRAVIPVLHAPVSLMTWCASLPESLRWVLDPVGDKQAAAYPGEVDALTFAVGPEGGWSEAEVSGFKEHGFQRVQLGRRVLRTETAGLVALSVAQHLWGDFNATGA